MGNAPSRGQVVTRQHDDVSEAETLQVGHRFGGIGFERVFDTESSHELPVIR